MTNKKILSIDPSGNFFEGKGTTGWCILTVGNTNHVTKTGSICAKDYEQQETYWDAHIQILEYMLKKYDTDLVISMEDFLLYGNTAVSQINSHFETPQLIGVIKLYCYQHGIPLYIRPASRVKSRWSDEILIHKGIIKKIKGRYVNAKNNNIICEHEVDAIRHAMHCATFELERL